MNLIQWLRRTKYMMRVQRRTRSGRLRWGLAYVWMDGPTSMITIKTPWWQLLRYIFNPVSFVIPAKAVTSFQIEMMKPLFRDGLLLWLLGAVVSMTLPVVSLGAGEPVQTIRLRAVMPWRKGKLLTRFLGLDLSDFLRTREAPAALPDLVDDERWRDPLALTIFLLSLPVIALILYLLLMILPLLLLNQ